MRLVIVGTDPNTSHTARTFEMSPYTQVNVNVRNRATSVYLFVLRMDPSDFRAARSFQSSFMSIQLDWFGSEQYPYNMSLPAVWIRALSVLPPVSVSSLHQVEYWSARNRMLSEQSMSLCLVQIRAHSVQRVCIHYAQNRVGLVQTGDQSTSTTTRRPRVC